MRAFRFGYQSATYKFCGPKHYSRMGRYDRELHRLWANVNQWAEYDGELNGPKRALAQRAFNMIWANLILSAGAVKLHQTPP